MKKWIYLVCLLALILSACTVTEQTPTFPEGDYTYDIFELTFKTKKISNHFVGNDWSFTYTLNGQVIESGHTITESVELFSFQDIDIEVREADKIDDVGIGTLTIATCDGMGDKTEITVTETDGRFKGNTAVWEITCEVKLVGKE